jgi:predicted PurR-regulated permease PerM
LDDIFIQPKIYGKLLNMHPLTIMIVVLLGGELLGILGMVLAIPIYTVVTVTARETNWGLKNYRITESHG